MAEDQGGWQYLDERLEVLWTTSVPQDEHEAMSYAQRVLDFFGIVPHFIYRRAPGSGRYEMIPYKYDPRVNKFVSIEEALT